MEGNISSIFNFCYSNIPDNLVENVVSNQIFINPSEFVLLENEKKVSFLCIEMKLMVETESSIFLL